MPRIAGRGRLLSFATALVVLSALLVVRYDGDGRSEVSLATSASCADVLLVLAPGNGEGAGTTPVSAGQTMGRFRDVYLREAARYGRTVETRVVPHRTRSLNWLRPSNPSAPARRSITARHAKAWGVNITWARDWTVSLLAQRGRACPHQSIVLGGYGQGAGVMHRVLRRLGTNATSRRVIGAALVSDPDRQRYTAALRWGSPAAGAGARGIMESTRAYYTGDAPVRGSYPRVLSVCRKYDVVCDFSGVRASTGLALAGSYYRHNLAVLDQSALDLATRTRGIPDPRPPVTQVAGAAGAAVRVQLAAEVLPHFRAGLRWAPTSPLPAGMTLSPTGLFSGTPRAAGTWTIGYTVRNPLRAAFNRPIPGSILLRVGSAPAPAPAPTTPQSRAFTSAGGDSSCTIRSDGGLWCWGDNYEGQVGVNSRENKTSPQRVGSSTAWLQVNTGGTHTCAITTAGALYCWGRNDYGQVGDGTRTRRLAPVRVGSGLYTSVATNTHHTCATGRDESLWCWGNNDNGQLGLGDRTTRLVPTRVGTLTGWRSVSTGAWHTCATRTNNSALCWGADMFGQLGRDGDPLVPTRISGPNEGWNYRTISAGDTHTCAVTTAGQAQCWGANTSGQVGDGTDTLRALPVPVSDGTAYTSVDAGLMTSCGVTAARQVRCWGAGWTGLLGMGALNTTSTPRPVATTTEFSRVEVGWGHTCATATSGAAWCWGLSSAGQIGKGNHVTVRTPVQVVS